MARDTKPPGLHSTFNGQVIPISSFQERLDGQTLTPAHVAGEGPRMMILLAEQAHVADRIEQAESLIEKAYALYDQCIREVEMVASEGNTAANDEPKNLTGAIRSPHGTPRSPLS